MTQVTFQEHSANGLDRVLGTDADAELGEVARDQRWLDLLMTTPMSDLVRNVKTRWGVIRVDDALLPVSINETDFDNSYVCSPYTACVLYPQSEVDKLPGKILPNLLRPFLRLIGVPLKAMGINRVVCVNNWLLSTNLFPKFDATSVGAMTRLLVERFPSHAIAFRSLNEVTNAPLMRQLLQAGYLLAPSRQVYFFDGANSDFLRRPNSRWDQKLLTTTSYRVVSGEALAAADAPRIEQLYRWLYVDKYSIHNPQFTATMFEECRRLGLLRMHGLRDESGRLDGIVGSFERNGVVTVPLVGYDTALPQKLGLYRMLMAIVLKETSQRRGLLNLSSGASQFKRLRGGTPVMEYMAVYCRHLSRPRRVMWHTLAGLLSNVGAPLLRKYKL